MYCTTTTRLVRHEAGPYQYQPSMPNIEIVRGAAPSTSQVCRSAPACPTRHFSHQLQCIRALAATIVIINVSDGVQESSIAQHVFPLPAYGLRKITRISIFADHDLGEYVKVWRGCLSEE